MERLTHISRFELPLLSAASAIVVCAFVLAFILMRVTKQKPDESVVPNDVPSGQKNIPLVRRIAPVTGLILLYVIMCWIGIRFARQRLTATPRVVTSTPAYGATTAQYGSPISVELNAPIDFRILAVNSNPHVSLTVTGHGYFGTHVGRTLTITPRTTFPAEQPVMMYLSNMKNPFNTDFGSEALLEFTTAPLPSVTAENPADGAADVGIDDDMTLALSSADTPQALWDVTIEPKHPFTLIRNDENLVIDFTEPLKQGTTYRVSLSRTAVTNDTETGDEVERGEKHLVYDGTFSTVKAPLVSSIRPEGYGVLPTDALQIVFDEPMDTGALAHQFAIDPSTDGDLSWNADGTELTFAPRVPFAKDTEYAVTLKRGISSSRGGVLEEDLTFRFHTLGPVTVISGTPDKTTTGVSVSTPITIAFDQEVDHQTAEEKFSVDPPTDGSFSWQENSMIFTPREPLTFGKEYSYGVEAGVASIHGVSSTQSFSFRFRTASEEFALTVPYFRQEENFTCNIAAARMLLAFRGTTVSEQELKALVGSSGTRGTGNPYKTYVADYGTYWDALAPAVGRFRPYRLFKDLPLTDLLTEVQKGNPVMVWGQNGWSDPHEISWTASDGTYVYAINGMHSYVVRGFRGPADNPTHILVNDPWRGVYALPTNEFMRRWSYFRVAMVAD